MKDSKNQEKTLIITCAIVAFLLLLSLLRKLM